MPQYEYECVEDGELLTLLRSMNEADAPVEDPTGAGRSFKRVHSVFGVGRAESGSTPTAAPSGCCPCGIASESCQHR